MMVIAQNMQDMIGKPGSFMRSTSGKPCCWYCRINRDFIGARLEPQEIQSLLQLYTAGTITQETLLRQLSDGEVLGDDFNVDEELEATANGGLDLQPARLANRSLSGGDDLDRSAEEQQELNS
jgi:hypothetical protein